MTDKSSSTSPKLDGSSLSPVRLVLLFSCFFLSGLTSLVLETAWSKELSYLLGVDLFGTASTVVAYMSGLGLGALLAARWAASLGARPFRSYALLQLFIGVAGLLSVPTLLATKPLFSALYQLSDSQALFLFCRFCVTLALLLPVTTLMGMTLPVVLGALSPSRKSGPRVAGLLYGLNTLGAVSGAVLAGFVLIPQQGLLKTCLIAGAIDLVIALLVWAVFSRSREPGRRRRNAKSAKRLAVLPSFKEPAVLALALSGVCALGLELSWFRLLVRVVGPSVQAFSITLAVFLTGIGLGSAAMSGLFRFFPSGKLALSFCLGWTMMGALLPAYYLDDVPGWYLELWLRWGKEGSDLSLLAAQSTIAGIVILPATLGLGGAFPSALWAYQQANRRAKKFPSNQKDCLAVAAGQLFFANTVGSVAGALLWAFLVLPQGGALSGIRLAGACSFVALVVVLISVKQARARNRQRAYLFLLALVALLYFVPPVNVRIQNAGVFSAIRSPSAKGKVDSKPLPDRAKLLFAKEGLNASVAVFQNRYGRDELDLAYSGKWVASTYPSSLKHLVLLGHLPVLLASPAPKRVLVIGMGSGVSSGSVLSHGSVEHVDIVEIEPGVPEAAAFFNEFSGAPLADPRTRLIFQDGRTHVVFGSDQYDVITSDPIHPWVKGAANLYTQEFYQGVRERLSETGVYCQWIPSSMSKESFGSIARTMSSVFLDVKLLFSHGEAIALASNVPVVFKIERLIEALRDKGVRRELGKIQLGSVPRLEKFLRRRLLLVPEGDSLPGRLNTDDNVALEHALPWDMFHGSRAGKSGYPRAFP